MTNANDGDGDRTFVARGRANERVICVERVARRAREAMGVARAIWCGECAIGETLERDTDLDDSPRDGAQVLSRDIDLLNPLACFGGGKVTDDDVE